ncbi:hypothetical protein J2T11_002666 [Paenarthrobacter nicotinovorans]|uniref:hypothetical protein n=1 Tax=Paenarthrobacter nicotinovorans TaxID=29320 RepID=UPI002784F127|nr:hypothetical protein [Paenarthrobacter nicotinovorans]MDP9936304.1 hypothetical protein [Paenarthrobacter nicotinovorans]
MTTAVISVFPVLFKDESNVQSLKTAMKPYRAESVSHFALPVGAPIDSFPSGGTLCTNEQEEWLQRYGVQFQRDYLIELRNSAGGGGSLAVANIRGHASKSNPVGAAYVVECDKSGDSGVVAEPGRLLLDSNEAAFFDKTTLGAAGTGQPNSPLAYNLRPGETGQVVLSLSARSDFTGDVVTSVSAGDRTSDVKISPEGSGEITIPGVLSPRTILITVRDGKLKCNVIPNPTAQISSCTADELFRQ